MVSITFSDFIVNTTRTPTNCKSKSSLNLFSNLDGPTKSPFLLLHSYLSLPLITPFSSEIVLEDFYMCPTVKLMNENPWLWEKSPVDMFTFDPSNCVIR